MAKVYKHQDKYWQACVTANGMRRRKNFPTQAAAKAWARKSEAALEGAHGPKFGGPAKVNVAGLLFSYANQFTLQKEGWRQEVSRINRYLKAVGLEPLVPVDPDDGRRGFVSPDNSKDDAGTAGALPGTFREHLKRRAESRRRTNALRESIARALCSRVSRADIREFISAMTRDGLSASSIQKEIALLKHAFRVAQEEWGWVAFDNPCSRVRLPAPSPPRDVRLSPEDETALRVSLAQCENPLMLVYFELAVQTTSRRGSLLRLAWRDVDFEQRTALLRKTKNGRNVPVPLTLRAVEVLRQARTQSKGSRVFDLTEESLAAAWGRAVARAGLPHLRVHDLRHIGTTRHASRVPNTQMLKAITGHRSDAMVARYVHFAPKDILPFLDATEPDAAPSAGAHAVRPLEGRRIGESSGPAQASGPAPNLPAKPAPFIGGNNVIPIRGAALAQAEDSLDRGCGNEEKLRKTSKSA